MRWGRLKASWVSSSAETRERAIRTVIALERACLEADAAIVERRWPAVDAAFRTQDALTERLASMFEQSPDIAPANDAKVAERVRGVIAFREDQLRRLRAYRDDVEQRLSAIGKVNAFSRSFGQHRAAARLVDGQY